MNDYLDLVKGFNSSGGWTVYPGSPFLIQQLLGDRDRLKLFELHPTDIKLLTGNIDQLKAGRQVAILREDGFEGLKKFLPPPSRRGLILCDPSYEMKTDYTRVVKMMKDAIQRFATGTYVIWYPSIARLDAQELPENSGISRSGASVPGCTAVSMWAAAAPRLIAPAPRMSAPV